MTASPSVIRSLRRRRRPRQAANRRHQTGKPGRPTNVTFCVQGLVSPLLANLYLHPLDELLAGKGYRMVRYADDFVVLCRSRDEAEAALTEIRDWVDANGLSLHPDKTHLGDCRQRGQGFDFLGYRFEVGIRMIRKKSLDKFKDKVREKTRRTQGVSLERVIATLNPVLKGWFGYFKHAHWTMFPPLDSFIRRRLRAILRKQTKRSGVGLCLTDSLRWPNSFFAQAGLFTLKDAQLAARNPR